MGLEACAISDLPAVYSLLIVVVVQVVDRSPFPDARKQAS